MTNVAKADKQSAFRPLVYICSPFSRDTEFKSNQVRKYSRFAYEQNTIPMTPHLLYPQFMEDENPKERVDAMHFNYVLPSKCKELWYFWRISPDLLVIDGFGLKKPGQTNVDDLYEVIPGRYETSATIITSNKQFDEWGGILYDPILATAISDRFVHHCRFISIEGDSYRMKERERITSAKRRGRPKKDVTVEQIKEEELTHEE